MAGKGTKKRTTRDLLFNFAEQELEEHEIEIFQKCLEVFPDINAIRDSSGNGNTLLHVAVKNLNLEVVRILIEKGADVNSVNHENVTPLKMAKRLGSERKDILNLLKKDEPGESIDEEQTEETIEGLILDADEDEIEEVKRKIGLINDRKLSAETVQYINDSRILHRFLEKEKHEIVNLLLDIEGIDVRLNNEEGATLADIAYDKKQFRLLVTLLEKDSEFPKGFKRINTEEGVDGAKELEDLIEMREKLHESIRSDDFELVKRLSMDVKSKVSLNLENRSALATSLKEKHMNIYAFLLSVGMEFLDDEEGVSYYQKYKQTEELKRNLEKYFRRDNYSPLHKILSSYKICGEIKEDTTNIFHGMFERIFRSRLLSPMLKVLQYENCEIIFDLNSETTHRICLGSGYAKGITELTRKRCFIGAKMCFSSNEMEVYCTLAHEICHLTVNFLYENYGLPYRWNESEKKKEYLKMVEIVDKNIKEAFELSKNGKVEKLYEVFVVLRKAYRGQDKWQKEVIARCCEILAQYGDEGGQELLQKHVPDLIKFYKEEFVEDCEKYSKDFFYIKAVSLPYEMSIHHGCLSKDERENIPFAKMPVTFDEYLLPVNDGNKCRMENKGDKNMNVVLLRTDNVYLCKMHVYQELKDKYKFHVDRKCLFFEYNYFHENLVCIGNVLGGESFEDVIIVQQNEASYDMYELIRSLIRIKADKRAIIIVDATFECNSSGLNDKFISYDWDSISVYWKKRLGKKEIIFQGKQVKVEKLFGNIIDKKLITSQLLSKIMAGVPIGDDGYSKSEQYDESLFIERYLVRKRLEKSEIKFESMKDYYFLTGIEVEELSALGFPESQIKLVSKETCGLKENARIVLPVAMKDSKEIFNIFCDKNANDKTVHWIHFAKHEFYHLKSKGNGGLSLELREDKIHEDGLVNSCIEQEERVVLIADDPGSGKSTVLTKLSILVKNREPSTWVSRLTFKELLSFHEEVVGLSDIFGKNNTEGSLELILNSIHKGSQAEDDLLKVLIDQPIRVVVFLDGFDELPSELRSRAIQLIKELRNNTKVHIWITSRTSHSDDLVIALETVPYNLKLWDQPEQCNYLCKLWRKSLSDFGVSKSREKILKIIETNTQEEEADVAPIHDFILQMNKLFEDDEMESTSSFTSALETVDFSKLSICLLKKALYTSEFDFLGIPLHVYMFGKLFFSNNFKLMDCSNSFILFSKFFHQKVDIFLIEKCGLNYGTEFGRRMAKREKTQIETIHKNIAKYNIGFDSIDYSCLRDDDIYPFLNEIGLVKVVDNDISFFHKTFEEHFFAASVFDDMNSKKCNGGLIGKIILESDLNNVKRFLNGALEGNMPETRVDQNFFFDFRLKDNFHKFVVSANERDVSHCIRLWEYIVINLESQEDDSVIEEFISYSKTFLNDLNYWSYSRVAGLRVLMLFRERKWISKIFYLKDYFFGEVILSSFRKCSTNELDLTLKNIEKYVSVKCSSSESLNDIDGENMDLVIRKSRKCLNNDLLDQLFKKKDLHGRNMLFLASLNNDVSVFQKVLSFAQKVFGDKFRDLLFEEDIHKRNILHNITSKKENYFRICEYLKCEFQSHAFKRMIQEEYYDRADLWETVRNSPESKLTEDLNFLRTLIDKELFIGILFKENSFGMTILNFALRFGYVDKFFILLKEARETIDYDLDIERSTFLKWLQKADADRSNIISIAAVSLDPGNIEIFYEKFRKILNDDKCFCAVLFEGILLCHDFAYKFKIKYNNYSLMVLDFISELITDDQMFLNDLFKSHDTFDGDNFMFIAVQFLQLGNMRIFFEKVKSVVDSNQMRELYLDINDKGGTVLHYACLNYEYGTFAVVFDEIIKAFECEEDKIKNIIMKCNAKGRTLLHLERIGMKSIDQHERYHYYIGLENIKELMFRLDFDGDTCLHRVRNRRRLDPLILTENILSVSKWLKKDDFQNFLLIRNGKGHNFYYYVKMSCNESDLFELLKFLKETLSEESFQNLMGRSKQ